MANSISVRTIGTMLNAHSKEGSGGSIKQKLSETHKAPKAQEAWLGRKKPLRRDAKIGFKAYFKQLTSNTPPRNPTMLKGLSMTFATLNARGLNGDSGRTERQIIVKTMRRENMMFAFRRSSQLQ